MIYSLLLVAMITSLWYGICTRRADLTLSGSSVAIKLPSKHLLGHLIRKAFSSVVEVHKIVASGFGTQYTGTSLKVYKLTHKYAI